MARILEVDPLPLSGAAADRARALYCILAHMFEQGPGRALQLDVRARLRARAARTRDDGQRRSRQPHPTRVRPDAALVVGVSPGRRLDAVRADDVSLFWRVRAGSRQPGGRYSCLRCSACAANIHHAATALAGSRHARIRPSWQPSGTEFAQWIRACDAGLTLALLAATFQLGIDHQAIAVPFVTVAMSAPRSPPLSSNRRPHGRPSARYRYRIAGPLRIVVCSVSSDGFSRKLDFGDSCARR